MAPFPMGIKTSHPPRGKPFINPQSEIHHGAVKHHPVAMSSIMINPQRQYQIMSMI
jgi:hypothetical protein